jgi:hypothetical protein
MTWTKEGATHGDPAFARLPQRRPSAAARGTVGALVRLSTDGRDAWSIVDLEHSRGSFASGGARYASMSAERAPQLPAFTAAMRSM